PGLGGTPQMLADLVPPGPVLGPRRQGQCIAEAALGTPRLSRAPVPAMRLLEVAHLFRAAGQYIGEDRLGLRRAGLGAQPRPFERSGEIRLARLLLGEQAFGPIAVHVAGETVDAQPAEQGLRLDMPLVSGALQPARAFNPAGRHSGPFEIAAGDAVLR